MTKPPICFLKDYVSPTSSRREGQKGVVEWAEPHQPKDSKDGNFPERLISQRLPGQTGRLPFLILGHTGTKALSNPAGVSVSPPIAWERKNTSLCGVQKARAGGAGVSHIYPGRELIRHCPSSLTPCFTSFPSFSSSSPFPFPLLSSFPVFAPPSH